MSILALKASHEFWRSYNDLMIYRVIAFMETVENWTIDGNPALETAVDKLGNALENADKLALGKEREFIKLGCHLKMSRILRLLQALDAIEPGTASKVLMFAEEHHANPSDPTSLFLRRNVIFERLRLLSRVFSPERFNLVIRAMEGEENE